MKNRYLFLMLIISQFSFFSCGVAPESIGTEGLDFYIINDNECAVGAGQAKLREEIVIPQKYKQYTVTTILGDPEVEKGGFAYCENLKKITIPDTITRIGKNAFFGCTLLNSINIPDTVTVIEDNAFYNCSSLLEITGFKCVESIGEKVFWGCSSLESIIIPSSLSSINKNTFYDCTSLQNVVISDGVKTIDSYAFYNCVIEEMILPDSIEKIDSYAFYKCGELIKISYGSGLNTICDNAFRECSSLRNMYLSNNITHIGENAFFDCNSIILYCEPLSRPSGWNYNFAKITTSVHLHSVYWGVTDFIDNIEYDNLRFSIINNDLYVVDCYKNEADVSIPSSIDYNNLTYDVKFIGENAFKSYFFNKFCSIQLPDSILSIYKKAFLGSHFGEIKLSNGLKYIGESAFESCNSLNRINIPNTVDEIDMYAFDSCHNLQTILIPNSVKKINYNAFIYCENLKIFCEQESKPEGWNSYWVQSGIPVYWAGQWEYDEFGKPKPL